MTIGSVVRRSAVSIVLVFTLAACESRTSTATSSADDQEIQAAVRTFETGWNTHDMDTMFQAFTADAEWVNIVGMWWRGLADVKRATGVYHQTMFKDTPYHIEDLQVRLLSSDAAIAVVTWKKGSFVPPGGSRLPEGRDRMSLYLVKRSGRWLIAGGHNTTIDEQAQQFDPARRQ